MIRTLKKKLQQALQGQKFDLAYLLQTADPTATYEKRVEWLERVVDWIRYQPEITGSAEGRGIPTRIRFMLQLLDRNPRWKENTAQSLRSIFRDTPALRSYSEMGVPTDSTFVGEILSRLFQVILPHALEDRSLEALFLAVFYHRDDPRWISELTPELRRDLLAWFRTGLPEAEPVAPHWLRQAAEAMVILSTRVAGICFHEEMRARAPEFPVDTHPALQLQALTQRIHAAVMQSRTGVPSELERALQEFQERVQSVRALMVSVRAHMEEQGISVNLVYQADRVKLSLERTEVLGRWVLTALVPWFDPKQGEASLDAATEVTRSLIWGSRFDSDFKFVFRKGAVLLSRKIAERTGETGEGYIAQTPAEWRHLFLMGAGGGAVTAFTAFFKYVVTASHWPPFLELVYYSTNYAVSFLVMHFVGFKLASKQPSMTAATLAKRLKEGDGGDQYFVDEIARISRSQFAAALGNVALVVPVAALIDLGWKAMRGSHFLSPDQAVHFIHSIHPAHTLMVVYATWTGVLLWLSAMMAGWFENAVVFYDLKHVLLQQRNLRLILGSARLERLAAGLPKHASGVAGAISLGVLLGCSPAVGNFFGLPLDSRHVTLSSAALGFAWSTLGIDLPSWSLLAVSVVSIVLIALLNFGVSFALATLVAFRAREVSFSRFGNILKLVASRFLSRPMEFLVPGRSK